MFITNKNMTLLNAAEQRVKTMVYASGKNLAKYHDITDSITLPWYRYSTFLVCVCVYNDKP